MKRLMTLAIALTITGFAFGQKKTANNPLVSEQNYKHPFAAAAAKENNIGATEKFSTEKVNEEQDYKHKHSSKAVDRVRVRRGSGASPASSHKHPLG
jgi:hypothetical protein